MIEAWPLCAQLIQTEAEGDSAGLLWSLSFLSIIFPSLDVYKYNTVLRWNRKKTILMPYAATNVLCGC